MDQPHQQTAPQQQEAQPTTSAPAQNTPTQNGGGRKPDFIAYNVQENGNGKAFFSKVGAAWAHKDGQGFEVNLDAVPVNGRVSLRTLRENRMQDYQNQQGETQAAPQQMSYDSPSQ